MRRFATLATIALSLSLCLGLITAGRLFAQDEKKEAAKPEAKPDDTKKDEAKKTEEKKEEPKKDEAKKDETKKDEAKPAEPEKKPAETRPNIPPEVQAKLDAARKAVAEAIAAAEEAGLVKTTIDPPPILDILINGFANDEDVVKSKTDANPEVGVSPEVFGAWFTDFHKKIEGVTAEKNIRIMPPSKGLTDYYRARATILNRYLADARKARGGTPAPAAAPGAETKKEEAKPEAKKDEAKPEEKKAEEKKDEAPK